MCAPTSTARWKDTSVFSGRVPLAPRCAITSSATAVAVGGNDGRVNSQFDSAPHAAEARRPVSDRWVALSLDVPSALADALANFLIEAGAPGVVTGVDDPSAPPLPPGTSRLEAHVRLEDEPTVTAALARWLASLAEIDATARAVRWSRHDVAPVDWEASFRAHHRPLAIGERLLVAPPWDVPDAPGREVLVIEPGMAFGTGQHATTRTCLEEIEAAVGEGGVRSALDVGTGSGVLAAALARLGVPRVVAVDADPAVLPLARVTLLRNDAPQVRLAGGTAAAVRFRFDLVVANLLADALIADAPALQATVAPAGWLVVSGLLDTQVAAVVAAYPGWRVAAERVCERWRTLRLVRE